MKIQTKYHGEKEFQSTDLFRFITPLLGFEGESYFVLLSLGDELPFSLLQSVQTPDVAFYLISPWTIKVDYEFDLSEEQVRLISVEDAEDVDVYCIVTIPDDVTQIRVNLLAPIVVNHQTLQASQMILTGSDYSIRHPFFEGGVSC